MKHHDFPPRAEWHALDCRCRACVPDPIDDADWQVVGAAAILATIVVSLAMLAIDPAGTIATWTSTFR
ncbi:hypothetical protein GGQ80_000819 [Sphingomonas jinjuensis]|uniref:Uncharacterized protein n=1 Tax=Sphingomonas jinjuensis TaxID=535907 RepID=A0A840F8Q1_9SPHN|nr:hypothetical protein [Sphingomonas jinjuensis]MBB4152931.1 hypothetical protein [Sphingomonas jinjuensis]